MDSLSRNPKRMHYIFFLLAWFALPILVWGAMLCTRRRIHAALVCLVCLVSMIAGVFLLANYVWALDAHLLAEVDKHKPGTPEAERASEEWASDTDRSFTLLLSPVLTAVGYGVLFLLLFGIPWVVRQVTSAKHSSLLNKTESETVVQRGDDGNPYRPPTVG